MDNACESPAEKGGETGESDETAAAPEGPGAADTDGIPEETDGDGDGDLKEAAAEEGELKSQDISDLRAVEREDSSLLTPAAKKLKIDTKDKKEKKQKVDEDEIQKMQILVSSFSEEQLNRYEMYRRSAFPKAAIKRRGPARLGETMHREWRTASEANYVMGKSLDFMPGRALSGTQGERNHGVFQDLHETAANHTTLQWLRAIP
uniref:TATA-box binding protein associated factor 11 n=1 Tax=Equus asinus TaxID=9793 RepID=A0A9L0I9G7_EQUAS